jgi:hypothetical protein
LRELQQKRLGRSVTWHGTISDALAASGGRGLIFSNELVDAFPAKWLRWDGTRWEEVCVAYDPSQGLGEVFRELPAGLSPNVFSALTLTKPPLGQRIEILPSFRKWLHELAPNWHEGAMLTIDYGADSAGEIYRGRRDLRAFRETGSHERCEFRGSGEVGGVAGLGDGGTHEPGRFPYLPRRKRRRHDRRRTGHGLPGAGAAMPELTLDSPPIRPSFNHSRMNSSTRSTLLPLSALLLGRVLLG